MRICNLCGKSIDNDLFFSSAAGDPVRAGARISNVRPFHRSCYKKEFDKVMEEFTSKDFIYHILEMFDIKPLGPFNRQKSLMLILTPIMLILLGGGHSRCSSL